MAFAGRLADILHGEKPSDKWCLLCK